MNILYMLKNVTEKTRGVEEELTPILSSFDPRPYVDDARLATTPASTVQTRYTMTIVRSNGERCTSEDMFTMTSSVVVRYEERRRTEEVPAGVGLQAAAMFVEGGAVVYVKTTINSRTPHGNLSG